MPTRIAAPLLRIWFSFSFVFLGRAHRNLNGKVRQPPTRHVTIRLRASQLSGNHTVTLGILVAIQYAGLGTRYIHSMSIIISLSSRFTTTWRNCTDCCIDFKAQVTSLLFAKIEFRRSIDIASCRFGSNQKLGFHSHHCSLLQLLGLGHPGSSSTAHLLHSRWQVHRRPASRLSRLSRFRRTTWTTNPWSAQENS